MNMTRLFKAFTVAVVGCLLMSLCGFEATCEDISERVLRLHILAASDSEEDQALKLKVRDAILKQTQGLLDGVLSTSLAAAMLEETLPTVEETARRCLRENGSEDTVHVELCEMYFTTRQYEQMTMPAGQYKALRVVIGEGEGHNWWCVVFPPMCLSSACEKELDDVLTEQETEIVTAPARYEVRFKLVEWYQQLMDWVR